ncbi:MAG: alpha/beta hydrolase [Minwuia sp.]|uniref:alpha/beta hydrolase n=1 Tax=Minwuia sp. TaxID=2493630 RepID=UPI003A862171
MSELDDLLAFLAKQPPAHTVSLAERRDLYDRAEKAFPLPDGVTVEAWRDGDLTGDWLEIDGSTGGRTVLYLHGGGYGIGSSRSHRHLAALIGKQAKANALVLDYRLAPEHPYPAALDDAVAAYKWLAAKGGLQIAVAGDSAGGGLTAATLCRIRDEGLGSPVAGVCLSPWVDLLCEPGSEMEKAAETDPMVDFKDIREYANAYLGGAPANDPGASPIHARMAGLPPLLIQASSDEALRFDALRLADKAKAEGVDVTLEMEDRVPHVWHWFWPRLEIARRSVDGIAAWLEPRWGT